MKHGNKPTYKDMIRRSQKQYYHPNNENTITSHISQNTRQNHIQITHPEKQYVKRKVIKRRKMNVGKTKSANNKTQKIRIYVKSHKGRCDVEDMKLNLKKCHIRTLKKTS